MEAIILQVELPKNEQLGSSTLFAFVLPSPNTKFNVLFLFFFLDRKTFGQDKIEWKEFLNAAKCLEKIDFHESYWEFIS